MKRQISLFACFCCLFCPLIGSAQSWQWGIGCKTYGTQGFDGTAMTADNMGGIYVAGLAIDDSTQFGPFIIHQSTWYGQMVIFKTDSAGSYRYVINSGGTANGWPSAIATDNTGNLYVFGRYYGAANDSFVLDTITLTSTTAGEMYFLAKLSPAGHAIWATNVAKDSFPHLFNGGMGVDGAGNIYIGGDFDFPHSISIGSTTLTNTDTSLPYSTDLFLAKYDPTGHPIWAKRYGGRHNDYLNGFAVTPSGNFYITGKFGAGSAAPDTFVIGSDTLTDATVTMADPGTFYAKFDKDGNPIWAKTLNHHIKGMGMIITDPSEQLYFNGYIDTAITIGSYPLATFGDYDAAFGRFDSAGNIIWAHSAGGSGRDAGFGMTLDSSGDMWLTGNMNHVNYGVAGYTMNFQGNILTVPSVNFDPMYIVEYSGEGTYIFGTTLVSGGDDFSGLCADDLCNIYVGGDYMHVDMIFNTDTLLEEGGPIEDLFIAKYRYGICGTALSLSASGQTDGIMLYPNPAFTELNISSGSKTITSVCLTNLTGQEVYNQNYNQAKVQVDVAQLPAGLYFVKVNGQDVRKFVKE